jgi:uncharacterized protein (DUF302 family)
MKHELCFKKTVSGNMDEVLEKVTMALKEQGFGILTRIDFDQKIKEKLGKDVPQTVILGACNPKLAYEAFQRNTDVASLLPCNAVVRALGEGRISVELVKPSSLMEVLGDQTLVTLAASADDLLKIAIDRI